MQNEDFSPCTVRRFYFRIHYVFLDIPSYFCSWEKISLPKNISFPQHFQPILSSRLCGKIKYFRPYVDFPHLLWGHKLQISGVVGPLVARSGVINRLHICCQCFSDFNSPAAPATELRITKPLVKNFRSMVRCRYSVTKHPDRTHICKTFWKL